MKLRTFGICGSETNKSPCSVEQMGTRVYYAMFTLVVWPFQIG